MFPAPRRNRIGLAAALGLVALFPQTRATAQEWTGPVAFEVRVEDSKGHAVEGAVVALQTLGVLAAAGPAPLVTDRRGRLAIGGLAPGAWSLEVRKEGFLTFRAELAIAYDEKPAIVRATQHNVPGAKAVMRVRFVKLREAPAAKPAIVRASDAPLPAAATLPAAPQETAPAPPAVRPAPVAESPTQAPAPTPAPEAPVAKRPAPEPEPAPTPPVVEGPTPAPATAPAPTPPVAERPAPPPTEAQTPQPSPAAPAAPQPPVTTRPIERTCYECRPGESAIFTEAELTTTGSGVCPADLSARLASTSLDALPALLASLPAGCVVLRVDLPRTARYTGFRYESRSAAAPQSADCFPRQECAGGGGRFPFEPIVRREAIGTVVLAIFESAAPRTAGFTVYWGKAR